MKVLADKRWLNRVIRHAAHNIVQSDLAEAAKQAGQTKGR